MADTIAPAGNSNTVLYAHIEKTWENVVWQDVPWNTTPAYAIEAVYEAPQNLPPFDPPSELSEFDFDIALTQAEQLGRDGAIDKIYELIAEYKLLGLSADQEESLLLYADLADNTGEDPDLIAVLEAV